MSVGRFAMRGRVFQGRWAMPRALANSGEAPVVVAVTMQDGWVASPINRVSVAGPLSRVSVARAQGK